MFYEDNGFRDMFIYGSVALLAAMAMPSKKAHAAEYYLCNDGRMIEVNNSNRANVMKDPCVASWHVERQKLVSARNRKSTDVREASVDTTLHSTGYQIQTAGIEPLVNAVEVPEDKGIIQNPKQREKTAADSRQRADKTRTAKRTAALRPEKGLRYMGDGIYAQ